MVYLSGVTDHKLENENIVSHIVGLVEQKAAEIEATTESAKTAAD
jgi:(E)-4-hydroxy-3-methylbut-2-enyl-diphosphate synthase